jgi:hypothetical protein
MEPVDVSRKHFYISLTKSGLRIAGCIALLVNWDLMLFGVAFLAAEILGIVEEL